MSQDHWILDFSLCNMGGILLAHAVMWATDAKEYNWGGSGSSAVKGSDQSSTTPSGGVKGSLVRVLDAFTPSSLPHYEWKGEKKCKYSPLKKLEPFLNTNWSWGGWGENLEGEIIIIIIKRSLEKVTGEII